MLLGGVFVEFAAAHCHLARKMSTRVGTVVGCFRSLPNGVERPNSGPPTGVAVNSFGGCEVYISMEEPELPTEAYGLSKGFPVFRISTWTGF